MTRAIWHVMKIQNFENFKIMSFDRQNSWGGHFRARWAQVNALGTPNQLILRFWNFRNFGISWQFHISTLCSFPWWQDADPADCCMLAIAIVLGCSWRLSEHVSLRRMSCPNRKSSFQNFEIFKISDFSSTGFGSCCVSVGSDIGVMEPKMV